MPLARPQTAGAPLRVALDPGGPRVRHVGVDKGASGATLSVFITNGGNCSPARQGEVVEGRHRASAVPRHALRLFHLRDSRSSSSGTVAPQSERQYSGESAGTAEKNSHRRPTSALCDRTDRFNTMARDAWDAYLEVVTHDDREAAAAAERGRLAAEALEQHRQREQERRRLDARLASAEGYLRRRRPTSAMGAGGSAARRGGDAGKEGVSALQLSGLSSVQWSASAMDISMAAETFDVQRAREESRQIWNRLQASPSRDDGRIQPLLAARRASVELTPLQKLTFLRQNPDARREHAQRIADDERARRAAEVAERGNIKNRNVRSVEKFQKFFQMAKRATSSLRQAQRMENAKRKRDGLRSWKMARAIDDLQRPEFLRLQRARATEFEILQNTWLTIMVVSAALSEMHDRMLEHFRLHGEEQRIRRYEFTDAALQQNIRQRHLVRLARAATKIWMMWQRCRSRLQERRRFHAGTLVRKFLLHLGESIRIPLAVRKILRVVRLVQRRYRGAKLMRALRVELGCMQLERALRDMCRNDEDEVAKLKAAHKAFQKDVANKRGIHRLAKNEMITEHAAQTETQIAFLTRRQGAAVSMGKDLQATLVREAMAKKVSDFGNQTLRFGVALRFYVREVEALRREGLAIDSSGTSLVYLSTGQSVASHATDRRGSDGDGEAGRSGDRARKVPTKPIRPYLRCTFTQAEIERIVSRGMEILAVQQAAATAAASAAD